MLETIRNQLLPTTSTARSLVTRTLAHFSDQRFAVRLWNGEEVAASRPSDFTLVFHDAKAFARCLFSRDPAQFAECYTNGTLSVEGDLWSAVAWVSELRHIKSEHHHITGLGLVPRLVVPSSSHSVEHDRRDVQAHYDLSDEFFELYLDEKKVYSCAYFAHPDQSLEEAQERKLDLVCRKLDLQPGESLLDVGSGWGAQLMWAAKHYGVQAHGITLSENQAMTVQRIAKTAQMDDRMNIELRHYAELPKEHYDKICSVGMCEHVGRSRLGSYARSIYQALRPGGLFLNHCITLPALCGRNSGGSFIFRHVFPGAELVSVSHLQTEFENAGFEVLDVQSLRPHYALTLRQWFERFRDNRAQAAKLVNQETLRVWDLYLTGCAQAFRDGRTNVHQILLAKPDDRGRIRAPLTREQSLLATPQGRAQAPAGAHYHSSQTA